MKDIQSDSDAIAETEHFIVWRSEETEGVLYHVELGGITLHVTSEEWDELVLLIKSVA